MVAQRSCPTVAAAPKALSRGHGPQQEEGADHRRAVGGVRSAAAAPVAARDAGIEPDGAGFLRYRLDAADPCEPGGADGFEAYAAVRAGFGRLESKLAHSRR